jgi:hypothetical protein
MNQIGVLHYIRKPLLILLMGLLMVAGFLYFSGLSDQTRTAEAAGGGLTVYYKNTRGWTDVYIHWWNAGSPSPTWGSNPNLTYIGVQWWE